MTASDKNHAPSGDFILPLLNWFDRHAADLPWRRSVNPYHIWLSEIMLQQTQVNTVIPYYERFLERFPTVRDLAEAEQDDLMKQWEGLGYYRRARNLQAAAQQVVNEYDNVIPITAEELQKLKGIGRYTAGAIASIAFGEHVPVLDGNVIRVFSRLFNIEDDVRQAATKTQLWKIAGHLMDEVPAGKAGDYNQALMELGRTICRPRNPLCQVCPVTDYCVARAHGVETERPVKSRKAPTPHYDVTCGLIRDQQGELLIARRPDDALLGGLWEFPGGKQEAGESLEDCLARELAEELGIQVYVNDLFTQVQHAYTHFRITLYAFNCEFKPAGGPPECYACTDWRWVSEDELDTFAFSKADRKVIAELKDMSNRLF